jgi:hypothetical protein
MRPRVPSVISVLGNSSLAARLTAHLPDNHWNAKQASQPVQKHASPNTKSQMRVFIVTVPIQECSCPTVSKQNGGTTQHTATSFGSSPYRPPSCWCRNSRIGAKTTERGWPQVPENTPLPISRQSAFDRRGGHFHRVRFARCSPVVHDVGRLCAPFPHRRTDGRAGDFLAQALTLGCPAT